MFEITMAAHATKVGLRLLERLGHPAHHHFAVAPPFDVAPIGGDRAVEVFNEIGTAQCPVQMGGDPEPLHRQRLLQSLAQRACGAGARPFEAPRELLQLRLRFPRISHLVGLLHCRAHGRPLVLGQVLADITPLVHLATLDHRPLAPAGPNRAPQRSTAIDHEQPWLLRVHSPLDQVVEQIAYHRGILGGPLAQPEHVFVPVAINAQRDHHTAPGQHDAVHQHRQHLDGAERPPQPLLERQAAVGNEAARHGAAGDRPFWECRRQGIQRAGIAPRRDAGGHRGQRVPIQGIARSGPADTGQIHLRAGHRARAQALHSNAPAAQRDFSLHTPCAARLSAGVRLPLRAADADAVFLHHHPQHLLARFHAQREETLLNRAVRLHQSQRHLDLDCAPFRRLVPWWSRATLLHGGSFRRGLVTFPSLPGRRRSRHFAHSAFNRLWDIPEYVYVHVYVYEYEYVYGRVEEVDAWI